MYGAASAEPKAYTVRNVAGASFRAVMRRFIAALVALSLSWVTTGYACDMAQGAAAATQQCCCEPDAVGPCEHEGCDGMESGSACCQIVVVDGIDAGGGAASVGTFAADLQPLAPPSVLASSLLVSPSSRRAMQIAAHAPPPGWGTRTYLETARLRI